MPFSGSFARRRHGHARARRPCPQERLDLRTERGHRAFERAQRSGRCAKGRLLAGPARPRRIAAKQLAAASATRALPSKTDATPPISTRAEHV